MDTLVTKSTHEYVFCKYILMQQMNVNTPETLTGANFNNPRNSFSRLEEKVSFHQLY